MYSKRTTVVLIGLILVAFIALRVNVGFAGVGGFVFNVLTFLLAFGAATYVFQRSELNRNNR